MLVRENGGVKMHGIAIIWRIGQNVNTMENIGRDKQQRVRIHFKFRTADGENGVAFDHVENFIFIVRMNQAAAGWDLRDIMRNVIELGFETDMHGSASFS